MTKDFTIPSNPKLDAAISESNSVEDMRERMKSVMESSGVIYRERGHDFGAQVAPGYRPVESTPEVPLPVAQAQENCVRVIYPHGNDRFEIYAASEQELDEKEAAIRASY